MDDSSNRSGDVAKGDSLIGFGGLAERAVPPGMGIDEETLLPVDGGRYAVLKSSGQFGQPKESVLTSVEKWVELAVGAALTGLVCCRYLRCITLRAGPAVSWAHAICRPNGITEDCVNRSILHVGSRVQRSCGPGRGRR